MNASYRAASGSSPPWRAFAGQYNVLDRTKLYQQHEREFSLCAVGFAYYQMRYGSYRLPKRAPSVSCTGVHDFLTRGSVSGHWDGVKFAVDAHPLSRYCYYQSSASLSAHSITSHLNPDYARVVRQYRASPFRACGRGCDPDSDLWSRLRLDFM